MARICIELDDCNGGPSQPRLSTFTEIVGDGTQTDFLVNHNLGVPILLVQTVDVSTNEVLTERTVFHTSVNQVRLVFDSAPAADSVRVLIVGILPAAS